MKILDTEVQPIVWGREMFDNGTVGSRIFPSELIGRERSLLSLTLPLKEWNPQVARLTEPRGVLRVNDLLQLSATEYTSLFRGLRMRRFIKDSVMEYLLDVVAHGPEGCLLMTLFDNSYSAPIPASLERLRNYSVNEAMSRMSTLHQEVVRRSFGFYNVVGCDNKAIADGMDLSESYVEIIWEEALDFLEDPKECGVDLSIFDPGSGDIRCYISQS